MCVLVVFAPAEETSSQAGQWAQGALRRGREVRSTPRGGMVNQERRCDVDGERGKEEASFSSVAHRMEPQNDESMGLALAAAAKLSTSTASFLR